VTVSIRQYQKVYNKVLLTILKEGRVPTFDEVVQTAGDFLPDPGEPIQPTYKYIPQLRNQVFDINIYNEAVERIKTDLEVLFEENTFIGINNIQRVLHANLFHNVYSFETKRLNKQLDSLLFSLEGAEDNFFADFDTFNNLSKTNIQESTEGVVDTQEEALALPISAQGTFKVDLSSLYDLNKANINFKPSTLVPKDNIPGTIYGNAFKDTATSWGIVYENQSG
jgi:hypothetical protein